MKLQVIFLFVLAALFGSCTKVIGIEEVFNPEAFHNRSVGASAGELLSAKKFNALTVEIQYMTGFAPDDAAVANLHNFMATYLEKPAGINIVTREITPTTKTVLSKEEVVDIEKKNRTQFSADNTITIYLLYTNGEFTDSKVLGAAYRNTSAVIFGKTIKENSGILGKPSRTKLETTVLAHEVGHLLGLVDTGSAMQTPHKDDAHGSHCNNKSCLMYYAIETTDVFSFLLSGNIPQLDANCVADIRANSSH